MNEDQKMQDQFDMKITKLTDVLAEYIEPCANDKDLAMVLVAASGLMSAFILSYQGHIINKDSDFDQVLKLMHEMFDVNFRSGMAAGIKSSALNKVLDELLVDHLNEPSKQKH